MPVSRCAEKMGGIAKTGGLDDGLTLGTRVVPGARQTIVKAEGLGDATRLYSWATFSPKQAIVKAKDLGDATRIHLSMRQS